MIKRFGALWLAFLLAFATVACADNEGEMKIYLHAQPYLNAGILHGDCSLIVFPNGQKMLVDCGVMSGAARVAEWLISLDAAHIDWFVASHLHQDHVGAFGTLLRSGITVDEVIQSGYGLHTKDTDGIYVRVLQNRGLPVTNMRAGDSLSVGEARLDFLWPAPDVEDCGKKELADVAGELLNINSLVFRLSLGDFSMLYTGDIHVESEQALIDIYGDALRSDVLKLAHHGHKTSNSIAFIERVSPQAVVCMGRRLYNEEMPKILEERGMLFYGTWMNGTIELATDGRRLTVHHGAETKTLELQP